MNDFRRLMTVVLIAGVAAGLLTAVLQLAAIGPLIKSAEAYEHETHAAGHDGAGHTGAEHEAAWQPSDGFERTAYTVLGTVLTGIAYSALLFGVAALLSLRLDARRGVWLGLAGFACFALAPAIGLPPKPPGIANAALHAAQIWWVATAGATALGLGMMLRTKRRWSWRATGLLCLLAPHVIGAPHGTAPASEAMRGLAWRFAAVSLSTQAVFWLLLGAIGGYVSDGDDEPATGAPRRSVKPSWAARSA